MSETLLACIRTWHKHLGDYQFILWNESNAPMDHSFVKAAYEAGKYAFVSDYVRLWALYHHGGIYLDTDMWVIKKFEELLNDDIFIGWQDNQTVAAGIIGSIPENDFIKDAIEKYDNTSFDESDMSAFAIPIILTRLYKSNYSAEVKAFQPSYFYPYPFSARTTGDSNFWKFIRPETYAVHLWDASWIPNFKETLGDVETTRRNFYFRVIVSRIKSIFRF